MSRESGSLRCGFDPALWAASCPTPSTSLRAGSFAKYPKGWGALNAGVSARQRTGAFFLLLFEIVLGLNLKEEGVGSRRPVRRLHFWTMVGFIAALGLHLWLNG